MSIEFAPVNHLSNPKGVKTLCELCQQTAVIQCPSCKVTFYCSTKHAQLDSEAIHAKVCSTLAALKALSPTQAVGQTAQILLKKERREILAHIVFLSLEEGQALLFSAKHHLAVPAALLCLKYSKELYGESEVQLVYPFLVLAEASVGLMRLSHAEDYLVQAKYSLLNAGKLDVSKLKSKLNRIYGLLFLAQNQTIKARNAFANDIYYASICSGTTSREAAGGYFYLGNTFIQEMKPDIAQPLHTLVIDIWIEFFAENVTKHLEGPALAESNTSFSQAIQAEASDILKSLWQHQSQRVYSFTREYQTKLLACLAMLYFLLGDGEKAKMFSEKALLSETSINAEIDNILQHLST